MLAPGGSASSDAPARPGTDFGDGSLFSEIGHTLESVALESVTGAVVGLRTAVARQALATQEGQLVAGVQQGARMAPIILIVVLLLAAFVGYKLLRR
jgi:hypothetical protein